jgi:2-amino-4-hydroxy-6-hydroxymethyldihydropteridine diphosphokinase
MNKAYLLTGGNMGQRTHNLAKARQHIEQRVGRVLRASALYETAAWGLTDQPAFLNQVLIVETTLAAAPLMELLLQIEQQMGRTRSAKNAPRNIDIDILFFNKEIHQRPDLMIPHPQLQNRRFVLTPLNELSPQLMHPVLRQTMHQLLQTCPDPLDVKKF